MITYLRKWSSSALLIAVVAWHLLGTADKSDLTDSARLAIAYGLEVSRVVIVVWLTREIVMSLRERRARRSP